MFDKRVRLEWPDGPPLGLDRRTLAEKLHVFASTLLEPNPIVLLDHNGNPMNISVICSCGKAMAPDWSSGITSTDLACKNCGNRLAITLPGEDKA